ncbi:MAG: hypothetical protein ACJ76Z_13725 [Thermoleophilaceae bacterium]
MPKLIPPVALIAALVAVMGAHGSARVDPSDFTTNVDNPWFPLKPGAKLVYRGVKDGQRQRDVFKVTRRTKVVNGVRCVVVDDRVYAAGHLEERTSDYYAQDRHGTVWYFGEDTAELDRNGKVTSREGTWHAGVHGARAGIFMPAHPKVGEHHLQEYLKGHAEDHFRVLSLHARIKVPYGSFRNALRTKEWTPLEPGVVDNKYYVRGIGEVFEGSVKGAKEQFALVDRTFTPSPGRYVGTYTDSHHARGQVRLSVGFLRPDLPGVKLLRWHGTLRCPGHRSSPESTPITAARIGKTFSGYMFFPGGKVSLVGRFTAKDALRGWVRVKRENASERCDTGPVGFVAHRTGG